MEGRKEGKVITCKACLCIYWECKCVCESVLAENGECWQVMLSWQRIFLVRFVEVFGKVVKLIDDDNDKKY